MIFLLSSSRMRKVMRACFSQLKEKCSASQRDGANLNSLGALEPRRLALMSQFFGSCLAPSEQLTASANPIKELQKYDRQQPREITVDARSEWGNAWKTSFFFPPGGARCLLSFVGEIKRRVRYETFFLTKQVKMLTGKCHATGGFPFSSTSTCVCHRSSGGTMKFYNDDILIK